VIPPSDGRTSRTVTEPLPKGARSPARVRTEFLFTASTLSPRRIFTHFVVDEEYLDGLGITLPRGF